MIRLFVGLYIQLAIIFILFLESGIWKLKNLRLNSIKVDIKLYFALVNAVTDKKVKSILVAEMFDAWKQSQWTSDVTAVFKLHIMRRWVRL